MKTNTKHIRRLTCFVALLTIASGLKAELPDRVKEILEASVEASGGREKIEAIESTRMTGEMKMPAMGMSATTILIQSYPDSVYQNTNMGGMGEFVQAYDGTTAWSNDPMQGFRILSEAEKKQLIGQAGIRDSLDYETIYSSGKVLPDAVVNEEEVYVIQLFSTLTNSEETHYYSKATGLMVQMDMIASMGPQGELPATMKVTGYTEKDGYKFPTAMQIVNPAMTIDMTISGIEVNPEIDSSIFAPPQ